MTSRVEVVATAPDPVSRRALVLGGGGSAGNAWLIGVLTGLAEGGTDVTDADLVVGTSAGATAAAQLAGATPTELYRAVLATDHDPSGAPTAGARPVGAVGDGLRRMQAAVDAAADLGDLRRRLGAAARERLAASDGSWSARWRATVAARLPQQQWPDRAVVLTAVDARTGEPVGFDRHSGVDLADAVAASCAGGGLPYEIDGNSYLDGAYRRNENADLAVGYRRVLVLSPLGGRSLHPASWRTALTAQVEDLRAAGSRVETVVPTADSDHLFGVHGMDLTLRPAAARAGHALGTALAADLGGFWR